MQGQRGNRRPGNIQTSDAGVSTGKDTVKGGSSGTKKGTKRVCR